MKFNLYYDTKTKDNYLKGSCGNVEFQSIDSALKSANEMAKSNYYLNPVRDILEIMALFKVNEEIAKSIFIQDMYFFTDCYVEEIVEKDDEVELIKHYFYTGF